MHVIDLNYIMIVIEMIDNVIVVIYH